jgi:hypothetical protein
MLLLADTAGGPTPTTREEVRLVVDTMHHHNNNHTALHMEVDTIRSHTVRHHHMDPMLGSMVPSRQWAEIITVSLQSST